MDRPGPRPGPGGRTRRTRSPCTAYREPPQTPALPSDELKVGISHEQEEKQHSNHAKDGDEQPPERPTAARVCGCVPARWHSKEQAEDVKSARTGGTRPTLSMKTVSVLALLACLASRCNAFHALCGGLNAANVPSAVPSCPVMRKARVRAGGARLSMSADDFDMGAFFAEVALPWQIYYYATGRQFCPDDRLSQVDKRQAPSVAPGESMTVHVCMLSGKREQARVYVECSCAYSSACARRLFGGTSPTRRPQHLEWSKF